MVAAALLATPAPVNGATPVEEGEVTPVPDATPLVLAATVVAATLVDTTVERASEVVASAALDEATTLDEATADEDSTVVDAATVLAGGTLEATVLEGAADEEESWAQISPVTWSVVSASAVEQLLRTQGVAALVIADWFAASHWQAVSVALQEVAEEMALRIQV